MGFIEPSTVHQLAESLAIPRLSNDAAKALAPHIDVRLREIVQEASKFARHSKRANLTTEDVNSALRLKNCQPLYGFSNRDPARFVRAAGHPDLFYLADPEIPTSQVIETPLPRVPVEIGIVPHWLAIDGVQPNIPENAPIERPKLKRPRMEGGNQKIARQKLESSQPLQPSASQDGKADSQPAAVLPPVRLVISVELLRVFENLQEVIKQARAVPDDAPGGPFAGFTGALTPDSQLEPGLELAAHLNRERHALQCLAFDPGQHPLAAPTIELITEQVRSCMKQLPQLHLLVKVARSMLKNGEIEIERYLDKLLSPLMTCILTKRLGASPAEDHWAVRSAAADVIADICRRFGERFPNLPVRIVRQYMNAFMDSSKALPCHYGAIVGLTRLGNRTVQLMLLPYAQPYLKRLEAAMDPENPNEVQKLEAGAVCGALLHACASCMYASMTGRLSKDFFAQLRPPRVASASARLDFKSEKSSFRLVTKPAGKGRGPKAAAGKLAKQGSVKRGRTKGSSIQSPAAVLRSGADTELSIANGTAPSKANHSPKGAGEALEGEKADVNALEDAWREDSSLGKHLMAVHAMFGEAVQPYALALPISQVLL